MSIHELICSDFVWGHVWCWVFWSLKLWWLLSKLHSFELRTFVWFASSKFKFQHDSSVESTLGMLVRTHLRFPTFTNSIWHRYLLILTKCILVHNLSAPFTWNHIVHFHAIPVFLERSLFAICRSIFIIIFTSCKRSFHSSSKTISLNFEAVNRLQ